MPQASSRARTRAPVSSTTSSASASLHCTQKSDNNNDNDNNDNNTTTLSRERVWALVEQISAANPFSGSADALAHVAPPRPDEHAIPRHAPAHEQLPHIQQQLDRLSYSYLPRTLLPVSKQRPLSRIVATGRDALAVALPIRCLEATFVALYLTHGMTDLDRVPLAFTSRVRSGRCHHHIVLAVRVRTPLPLYGALGLSRKPTLMYKPLQYATLYDLVMDYCAAYAQLGHRVVNVKLGLAVPHTSDGVDRLCWRYVALRVDSDEVVAAADNNNSNNNNSNNSNNDDNDDDESCNSSDDDSDRKGCACVQRGTADSFVCSSVADNDDNDNEDDACEYNRASGTHSHSNSNNGSTNNSCNAQHATRDTRVEQQRSRAVVRHSRVKRARSRYSAVAVTPGGHNDDDDDAVATHAVTRSPRKALAHFLACYSELLTRMSTQYYDGQRTLRLLPMSTTTTTATRPCRLSYADLDTVAAATGDARRENARRVGCIRAMRSPLDTVAAATSTTTSSSTSMLLLCADAATTRACSRRRHVAASDRVVSSPRARKTPVLAVPASVSARRRHTVRAAAATADDVSTRVHA